MELISLPIRRNIALFVLLVSSLIAVGIPAHAVTNQLLSFDFTPKTVDVSSSGQSVTVTARARDDAGINYVESRFESPSHAQGVPVTMTLSSGTATDGTFQTTITIPQNAERGTWRITSIVLHSKSGSTGYYDGSSYPAGTPTDLVVGPLQTAATVTTDPATNVQSSAATLNSTVNPNGRTVEAYFQYGMDANFANGGTTGAENVSTSKQVAISVQNLLPNTTYYFRALLLWDNRTQFASGATRTFTTSSAPALPSVTTGGATNITSGGATLSGSITPNGSDTVYYFEYGTTTDYGHQASNSSITAANGTTAVAGNIYGLTASTTYHYRLVGQNAGGIAYGSDLTFTTSAAVSTPPSVTTGQATNITATGVRLTGTINPNGSRTRYAFAQKMAGGDYQYWTGTEYTEAETQPVAVAMYVINLTPNTTYTFRLDGTNEPYNQTTHGQDVTFTTLAATTPTVSTDPATLITTNGATLNGTVIANGSATTVFFQYGTTSGNYTISGLGAYNIGSGTTAQYKFYTLTGLSPNTRYYYRAYASNNGGVSYGAEQSFVTPSNLPPPPTVTTDAASSVGPSTANLNATVNPNGGATTVYFQYGTTSGNYTMTALGRFSIGAGTTAQAVNYALGGLASGTRYFYRAYAANNGGNTFGLEQSFVTGTISAPAITTDGASGVTTTAATLNAVVNANGNSTTVYFRYGTSSGNYTSTSLGGYTIGSGTTAQNVSHSIGGLVANTRYYYQAYASNGGGSTFGQEQSFVTENTGIGLPTVTTNAAFKIVTNTASVSADVNANGGATTVYFEVGTSPGRYTSGTLGAYSIGSGTTVQSVTHGLTGLAGGTRYYFRAFASNANGTTYGGEQNFVTSPAGAPKLATGNATAVSSSGAIVNGIVNANGAATTVYFQYGTSSGNYTSGNLGGYNLAATAPGQSVSHSLAGLAPGTRYFFRIFASNSAGTTYGQEESFITTTSPGGNFVDFNGDGYADYAVWNASTGETEIWWLQNTTVINKVAGPTIPVGWTLIAVRDFDGDYKADYILYDPRSGKTVIWLLDGATRIGTQSGPAFSAKSRLVGVWDFDGDSQLDYLILNPSTGRTTILYLASEGSSVRSNTPGPVLPAGYTVSSIVDINADGKGDWILADTRTGATSVWLMDGANVLSKIEGPTLPFGFTLSCVLDLNRDGQNDFILMNPGSGETVVWYMNGSAFVSSSAGPRIDRGFLIGGLIASSPVAAVVSSAAYVTSDSSILVGAVYGIGRLQAAFEYGTSSTYGNQTAWKTVAAKSRGTFVAVPVSDLLPDTLYHFRLVISDGANTTYSADQTFSTTTAGFDFNGDYNSDFIVFDDARHRASFWFLKGKKRFKTASIDRELPAGWELAGVMDLNNDGERDFLLFDPATGQTGGWLLRGVNYLSRVAGPTVPTGFRIVGFGDFDGDHVEDLVLANQSTGQTIIWSRTGGLSFNSVAGPTIQFGYNLVAVTDFDHDGKADFILKNAVTGQVVIWYLNGVALAAVAEGPFLPIGYELAWLDDCNRDGKVDLVLANPCTGRTAIYVLDGTDVIQVIVGPTLPKSSRLATMRGCDPLPEATLHSFTLQEGSAPSSLIQASDGNFYGTTRSGGAYSQGSVFRMSPAGVVTTLYSFSDVGSGGHTPYASVIQGSDGNFYGTTYAGGTYGTGSIFKMTPTGAVSFLKSLSSSTDGAYPYAPLLEVAEGEFYGVAYQGGANGRGTIFRITHQGNFTKVFDFTGTEGGYPRGGLIQDAAGNLYGTSEGSGSTRGTVFKRTPDGSVTALHTFTTRDGLYPRGGLLLASNGLLFGTAANGGAKGYGTVFKMSTAGRQFGVLHSFTLKDGADPHCTLVEDCNGNLYGTTSRGGEEQGGTVFKLTKRGAFTTLKSFETGTSEGYTGYTGLAKGSDCNLYGTTESGGSSNAGTVFRLPAE